MKIRTAVLLVPVLLALCVGTAAAKTAPQRASVDQHFGTHGSTVIAASSEGLPGPIGFAVAPSNKSYALDGAWLLAFRADGKPDMGFAGKGRLRVVPGPGKIVRTSGVTVDPQGRVLVAGTYEPYPGYRNPVVKSGIEIFEPFSTQPVTEVFVIRYLPDGEPDPSFGTGGIVLTNFGIPRPNLFPYDVGLTVEYEYPLVSSARIGVDSQGRPVIVGTYYFALGACTLREEETSGFIGRLTASGGLDPSFGGGKGYVSTPGTPVSGGDTAIGLASAPGNGWVALTSNPGRCIPHDTYSTTLSGWTEAGALTTTIKHSESIDLPFGVDQQGDIVYQQLRETYNEVEAPLDDPQSTIIRLLPSGATDTSFGFGGGINLSSLGVKEVDGLAIDAVGRTVVAFGTNQPEIARLLTNGKVDKSFGARPVVRAEIGKEAATKPAAVAIDSKGRILVAGGASGRLLKTGGVAITRFLPGN